LGEKRKKKKKIEFAIRQCQLSRILPQETDSSRKEVLFTKVNPKKVMRGEKMAWTNQNPPTRTAILHLGITPDRQTDSLHPNTMCVGSSPLNHCHSPPVLINHAPGVFEFSTVKD